MGTRGVYSFRKNGVDKITYNHYDSYPDCLGANMIQFIGETSLEELNDIYDRIQMVNENAKPTAEQIEKHKKFADVSVSTGSLTDWYCLLRETQGNLNCYKNGCEYMIDSNEFIKDSLFCEYGYIINLDTQELEFWVGFQHEPDHTNRYGTEIFYEAGGGEKYYPCKMLVGYDLRGIQLCVKQHCGYEDDYIEDMKDKEENSRKQK